jgi:hypothetical protein
VARSVLGDLGARFSNLPASEKGSVEFAFKCFAVSMSLTPPLKCFMELNPLWMLIKGELLAARAIRP